MAFPLFSPHYLFLYHLSTFFYSFLSLIPLFLSPIPFLLFVLFVTSIFLITYSLSFIFAYRLFFFPYHLSSLLLCFSFFPLSLSNIPSLLFVFIVIYSFVIAYPLFYICLSSILFSYHLPPHFYLSLSCSPLSLSPTPSLLFVLINFYSFFHLLFLLIVIFSSLFANYRTALSLLANTRYRRRQVGNTASFISRGKEVEHPRGSCSITLGSASPLVGYWLVLACRKDGSDHCSSVGGGLSFFDSTF